MPHEPKLVINMPSQKAILCAKDQYLSDISLNALQKGKELLAQNKLKEAVDNLNIAHGENPYHIDTLINMGAIAHASRDDFTAIKLFQRVCEISPDFVSGHNLLAKAYMAISEHEKALPELQKAHELDNKNTRTLIYLSELYLIMGDRPQAKIYARKAIDTELSCYTAVFYGFYFLEPEDDNAETLLQYIKEQIEAPITDSYKLKIYRVLAKYHEKIQNYDAAFQYMEKFNPLKKSTIRFDDVLYRQQAEKVKAFFNPSYVEANKNDSFDDSSAVFVFGMPRSGTTLLEQILCAHPSIETIGEYQHLSKIIYDKFAMPPHPDTGETLITPKSQDVLNYRSLGQIYANTLDLIAPQVQKVVNKAMDLHITAGFIATALPNARFIHCVRNPLDTAVSCYATLFERDSQPYCYDLEDIASLEQVRKPLYTSSIGRWKNYRNHLEPFAKALGEYCPEDFWETAK